MFLSNKLGKGSISSSLIVLTIILIPLLLGCTEGQDIERQEDTATPTTTSAPSAVYQTGVHLQGVYEIPDWLRSLEPFNSEMEYLLYLPDGYGEDPQKKWPLIVFLHGSGDDDYDSSWVMSVGLPQVLLVDEQPDNFDFIVLSPQSFDNTAWWERVTPHVVNALIDEIAANYQVDDSRVYLTGLSMGGYGSWYVASAKPERYAAMSSISGSGYRISTLPTEDVLCQLKDVPIWAIHGELDQISNAEANRFFLKAYEELCEGEIKITFYPDEGHFGAYARAYRDPALYDWFLERSKPQTGNSQQDSG